MRTVLFLIRKEYLQVFRDRATVFQVFLIPIVQLLVLANAATFEIRNARMYVVDLDRTTASRGLVERMAASGRFSIASYTGSMEEANRALLARAASVILHIPEDFEERLVRDRRAPVQLVLNAEEGAAASIVQSYVTRILADYAAELGTQLQAQVGNVTASVSSDAPESTRTVAQGMANGRTASRRSGDHRIEIRARGWYNPELDYVNYMVPGILVSLVTIIGTLLTAQNIAREKELGTLEQLNATPLTRTQFIAGKLIPFWGLAYVDLLIGLALARFVFDVPMRGSLLLVFGSAAIYLVVALGIGLWVSTVAETQQQAQFVTFFIMMIYLLMSGLFTPVSSMPEWAQWLAELNPVKHFVVIMRAVLVKGAGLAAIQMPLYILTLYGAIVLTLAVRQYSKTSG